MNLDLALNVLKVGPNGGNLENPEFCPEGRRSEFKPQVTTDGALGLHRFQDTAVHGIKDERPWHRMAAYMLLAKRTNSEIAMAAGVHVNHVKAVRKQLWFQQLLATIANDKGEEVTGVIESYTIEAVETAAEIMRSAESDGVKLKAAQVLIEQARGKPAQYIRSESVKPKDPKDELEEINRELEMLRNRQSS